MGSLVKLHAIHTSLDIHDRPVWYLDAALCTQMRAAKAQIVSTPAWAQVSGDSWMYPYQRTPMGNPNISPIYPYIVGVYGLLSPKNPYISPISTMGTLLGVHPIVPWKWTEKATFYIRKSRHPCESPTTYRATQNILIFLPYNSAFLHAFPLSSLVARHVATSNITNITNIINIHVFASISLTDSGKHLLTTV